MPSSEAIRILDQFLLRHSEKEFREIKWKFSPVRDSSKRFRRYLTTVQNIRDNNLRVIEELQRAA